MTAITRATALMLLTATAAAAATETLSPGSTTESATIDIACPTFSWAQLPDARGYELVVYRLGEDGSPAPRPEVEKSLPVGAGTWTLDHCLEPGGRYAWSVRALPAKRGAGWSGARIFRVAVGPSIAELAEALAALRRQLEAESSNGEESSGGTLRRATGRGQDIQSVPEVSRFRDPGGPRPVSPVTPPSQFHNPGSSLLVDGDLILRKEFGNNNPFVGIFFAPEGGFNEGIYMDTSYNLGVGRVHPQIRGSFNTAVGRFSQHLRESGSHNTSIGDQTLFFNELGSYNTAIGSSSLALLGDREAVPDSVMPSFNTAVGRGSLLVLKRGSYNIALGADAGVELERSAPEDSTSSFSWNIYIGNEGKVEDEHTIRIGRQFADRLGHERTFIAGDVAIGTQTGPTNRLVVRDTINGNGGAPGNYVALMENTNSGDSPDVLALKVGATAPGSGINFLGFFDGDDNLLGEIEGNALGGVRYTGHQLFLIPTDTPPACIGSRKGMLYYDESVNRPCYCDGTNWRSVVADGLCT